MAPNLYATLAHSPFLSMKFPPSPFLHVPEYICISKFLEFIRLLKDARKDDVGPVTREPGEPNVCRARILLSTGFLPLFPGATLFLSVFGECLGECVMAHGGFWCTAARAVFAAARRRSTAARRITSGRSSFFVGEAPGRKGRNGAGRKSNLALQVLESSENTKVLSNALRFFENC